MGFGRVAAGRAIEQLPVRCVVGKALGGAGEITADIGHENRRVERRRCAWVQRIIGAAKVESAAGVGPINQNIVSAHLETVERLVGQVAFDEHNSVAAATGREGPGPGARVYRVVLEPAGEPVRSTSHIRSGSTRCWPRPTFTGLAPGGIRPKRRRSRMPDVSGVSGSRQTRISLNFVMSSSPVGPSHTTVPGTALRLLLHPRTLKPTVANNTAAQWPSGPSPSTPSVRSDAGSGGRKRQSRRTWASANRWKSR